MQEYEVELKTAGGTLDCFVCHPEEKGPHPGIIFYMDAPGIREELRDMVRRIAATGYTVLLPNMYYRIGRENHYGYDRTRTSVDDAERQKMFDCMNTLDNAMVVEDTAAMLDFLRNHEAVAAGPLGCVGYCMSGRYVVSVAAAYPDDFAAIASFYGVGIITEAEDSPHLKADKIKGELYLAFASDDPYVPAALLERMPDIFANAGIRHRIEIYPETEHGFAFPERQVYVKAAAERHWERLHTLFDENLRRS
jgi:carboxymethylenebutenolidase